ncbi:MAG: aspartate/glutamate racemase family protein [Candidatus Marinimicrobia bacterium]|nr:aspartate/glutamate racemase family protein [Candidatus Neomarinimicrobiota bacterium]
MRTKNNIAYLIIFILFLMLNACAPQQVTIESEDPLSPLFQNDSVTILVTDSGLGGLSVAANIANRMESLGVFSHVEVIFFNAQPSKEQGYNSMKSTEQKVAVFNNALEAMAENFNPDVLLIACNTLSVLYDYTEFSKHSQVPVVGVVEAGIDLMEQGSKINESASILLFATETTVQQNTHKEGLVQRGLKADRIITQACPHLAGAIERGTNSVETDSLVEQYTQAALANLPKGEQDVIVSLNCTHYPYIRDKFRDKIEAQGTSVATVLDPNPYMADGLFPSKCLHRFPETDVSVYVLSQPVLDDTRIQSIAPLIREVSGITADALENWDFDPQFFEWEAIVHAK